MVESKATEGPSKKGLSSMWRTKTQKSLGQRGSVDRLAAETGDVEEARGQGPGD